jgi:hypothetical protein
VVCAEHVELHRASSRPPRLLVTRMFEVRKGAKREAVRDEGVEEVSRVDGMYSTERDM